MDEASRNLGRIAVRPACGQGIQYANMGTTSFENDWESTRWHMMALGGRFYDSRTATTLRSYIPTI